jgi:hypothetical protein
VCGLGIFGHLMLSCPNALCGHVIIVVPALCMFTAQLQITLGHSLPPYIGVAAPLSRLENLSSVLSWRQVLRLVRHRIFLDPCPFHGRTMPASCSRRFNGEKVTRYHLVTCEYACVWSARPRPCVIVAFGTCNSVQMYYVSIADLSLIERR